jgi:hypothetical protein
MDRKFGGVIWTNHALERLSQRGIKQGDAWATFKRPDQSRKGTTKDTWVYYRTWGDQKVEVVTKKGDHGETLILSVWSDKVYRKVKEPFIMFLLRKLFR